MMECNKYKCDNMMHSMKSNIKNMEQDSCEDEVKKEEMSMMQKNKTMEKYEEMNEEHTLDMSCKKTCNKQMNPIYIGDKMPKLQVKTTMGNRNLPDDYLGKWLVLFSHPADFTPVCTTEFVSFAKNYENFKQLDTELLGLSVDQVQPHMEWMKWIEENLCMPIKFPIIADAMGKTAERLGMINSKKSSNTARTVFIIDPLGVIRLMLTYPQEVGRNIEEIIRAVAALQVSDKNKVVMPANWPNNELIGDNVIMPPPSNVEDMNKNKEKYCNYDWWFCYKELQ